MHIRKHEDKDISIYISSGTSLITAFLTMLGLEKDRQIEYLEQYLDQSTSTIKSIEISKEDALLFIKSLALEYSFCDNIKICYIIYIAVRALDSF
jgi:hypothetical protein